MSEIFKALAEADPLQSWWPFVVSIAVGIVMAIKTAMGGQECPSKDRLDGQTIVVVDGTDAVSSEVIRECCARGAAHIILGCCDVNDGQAAVEQLKDVYADIRFTVKQLNLSEIDSIHEFSQTIPKEVEKIDLLVNNTRNLAAEQQIFRGSFALIFSLLPVLRKSTNGRVVNVVNETFSTVGFGDFDATANATGDGKSCGVGHLALLAATKWIAMKSKANKSSVTINACTIGTIRGECGSSTEALIGKWLKFPFDWILKKTPKQGAQTIIYLSVAEQVRNMSGELFTDCEKVSSFDLNKNLDVVDKLMVETMMDVRKTIQLEPISNPSC